MFSLYFRDYFVIAVLVIGIGVTFPLFAQEQKPYDAAKGYWWYEDPVEEQEKKYARPHLPAHQVMMQMHPDQIQELLLAHRKYAVYVGTPEAVKDYYTVQDVARRKAKIFTALTRKVMLDNPHLNARTEHPITTPGQKVARQQRDQRIEQRLVQERENFALVMFTLPGCQFCVTQSAMLKHFQQRYGWQPREVDMQQSADLAARFAIEQAPVTIIARRGTDQWQTVAVGVASLPELRDNTYRAIRFLRGEISSEQYLLEEGQEGGFDDPFAEIKEAGVYRE